MNNFNRPNDQTRFSKEMMNMYPEIYYDIYPHVSEVASNIRKRGQNLTEENFSRVVDDVIKACGMWDEDEVNVSSWQSPSIFQQPGFGRGRRRFHNRNTLRDLIRILLLRELLF